MKLMTEIEKLMVSYKDDEIEVMGNRLGLKNFGEICLALSRLCDEEANDRKSLCRVYEQCCVLRREEPSILLKISHPFQCKLARVRLENKN